MKIDSSVEGDKLYLRLEGKIDSTNAGEVEEKIMELLGDMPKLVLNFKDLVYLSSSGLRLLLKLQKLMNTREGMEIYETSDFVNEIFDMTGFDEILTLK